MEEPSTRRARRRAPGAWPAFPGEHGGTGVGSRHHQHQEGELADPLSPAKSGSSRSKSLCCNSCRPHQRINNKQSHASRGQKIEYDDVFGGPPKYFSSICASTKKKSTMVPDYDDIFRFGSPTAKSPAAAVKSKARATELPVFETPEYSKDSAGSGASLLHKYRSPPLSPIGDIAYDDVFGGPLKGTSTKLAKELLKLSGKLGPKSRPVSQSDSSPVSSMHSASHGNPIYDYDDVFGGQSPATLQSFIHMASDKKPVVTSVSVTSSPFGDQFDASTVPSSSPGTSRPVRETVQRQYDKIYKSVSQADSETTSSSSSGSLELDFRERGSANGYGKVRRRQRCRNSSKSAKRPVETSSNEESPEEEALETQRTRTTLTADSASAAGREELKDTAPVSFVTVENVKLTTEPRSQPPARPAPSQPDNSETELPESEAFMEYSIKDLDGLVAEEYVVSHESVSESSSSSLKTSPSSQSRENTDHSEFYEGKGVKVTRDKGAGTTVEASPAVKVACILKAKILENDDESVSEEERGHNRPKMEIGVQQDISGARKEEFSSSSSSFSELRSPPPAENTSGEWSTLCDFEEIKGESPGRRKSRLERHQRAQERVANAIAERNDRHLEVERIAAEKQKVADHLDDVIKRWVAGKQGNVRALLSTLQYILWPECGWKPVSLIDIIEPVAVRKAYRRATLCVHPDKMQQKGATLEHKYIAEKVFGHLQEAWAIFNYEQVF